MVCYRDGGCGPYEMLSCTECPASKPEYLLPKGIKIMKDTSPIIIMQYDTSQLSLTEVHEAFNMIEQYYQAAGIDTSFLIAIPKGIDMLYNESIETLEYYRNALNKIIEEYYEHIS